MVQGYGRRDQPAMAENRSGVPGRKGHPVGMGTYSPNTSAIGRTELLSRVPGTPDAWGSTRSSHPPFAAWREPGSPTRPPEAGHLRTAGWPRRTVPGPSPPALKQVGASGCPSDPPPRSPPGSTVAAIRSEEHHFPTALPRRYRHPRPCNKQVRRGCSTGLRTVLSRCHLGLLPTWSW